MVDEILPGILRLEIPLPRNPLKALNAYLIRGRERHLLVDTGFNRPECRDALCGALDSLGIAARDLDFFLTHMHADHSGLAATVSGPDAVFYASAADGNGINNTTRGPAYWDGVLRRMIPHGMSEEQIARMSALHPAILYCPSRELDFTVAGTGDVLRYGEYALSVIETPGHTPGHLVLYEPSRKILFSGDLILGDITPNICRWPNMADSLGQYLTSLDVVEKLDITLTLPGHRSLVRDVAARIGELREHHEKRLDEVRSLLRSGAKNAYDVASGMTWDMRGEWPDFPVQQQWFATGEALAHLDRLTALGEAEEKRTDGAVLFTLRATRPARSATIFSQPGGDL